MCKCSLCQEDCSHPQESIEESKMSYGIKLTCMDCGKVVEEDEIEDYDPTPCCAGMVTSGGDPASCMCDLDEPYADNH